MVKQAGLSIATLEISAEFYNNFKNAVLGLSVLLVNLDQNIGLETNQIIGDIGCFPG